MSCPLINIVVFSYFKLSLWQSWRVEEAEMGTTEQGDYPLLFGEVWRAG